MIPELFHLFSEFQLPNGTRSTVESTMNLSSILVHDIGYLIRNVCIMFIYLV
jgi:hypothetical protein